MLHIFKKPLTALIIILLLALFLRFQNLAANPPGLNWDEVAFAYNAHSIIETGKDEFGKAYPLYFRSLDDYKLPVYMYLTVLSELVFGYNNFAVRFPAALFGSATIIIVYFLTQQLFKNKTISLLTAFLLAILPWHIQFSRMAAEATVGLFFFVTAILLFLYSVEKRLWLLPVSLLLFAFSQYTYLSFRFIAPLVLLVLVILYYKKFLRKNIYIYISCTLILLFYLFLGYDSYLNRNSNRAMGIAAVTPYSPGYMQDFQQLMYDGTLGINIQRRIFHDSHLMSTTDILGSNYLSHFSPLFLFYDNNQQRHYTPGVGLMYLWMLPFILAGAYYAVKKFTPSSLILFSLFLLFPLPAAFPFDAPNAIRTIGLALPFCLLASIGIYWITKQVYIYKKVFVLYIVIVVSITGFYFLHYYHQNTIHLPHETSDKWQYGRREMTAYIVKNQKKYQKIIVSTSLEWPNVFFLYYSGYDPKKHLAQGGTVNGSFDAQNNKIENIEFRTFHENEEKSGKTLLVGKPSEFSADTKPVYEIRYLNGESAIYFVEKDPT